MSQSNPGWQPTTIRRFVRPIASSARTAVVETDAGKGYLKALGNPEGPHVLACEWVGTGLAAWLGLSTFDYALIQVTEDDEIPFEGGGQAAPGPAFITRAESGEKWSGHERQLTRLANPDDISWLVVFDTWTLNCDRYCELPHGTFGRIRNHPDNVFLSEEAPPGQLVLKATDHTHCFTCGRDLTKSVRRVDTIKDERVFGDFPAFRRFRDRHQVRQAAKKLQTIDRETVTRMTQALPREWVVARDVQEALVDLILRRAVFVAETIEGKLWPQRELPFGDPNDTEHPS